MYLTLLVHTELYGFTSGCLEGQVPSLKSIRDFNYTPSNDHGLIKWKQFREPLSLTGA